MTAGAYHNVIFSRFAEGKGGNVITAIIRYLHNQFVMHIDFYFAHITGRSEVKTVCYGAVAVLDDKETVVYPVEFEIPVECGEICRQLFC